MRIAGVRAVAAALLAATTVGTTIPASADDAAKPAEPAADAKVQKSPPRSVLDFTMPDVDGKPVKFARFRGEVLLLVNTASQCGYTPQYAGLEAIYRKYKKQGFQVLAFPANDFGQQEPGTNEEIKAFCKTKYDVTFPIFAKIVVKGEEKHPLYRFLTEREPEDKLGGEIRWNFTKFLVGRDGKVLGRFEHRVAPEDERLIQAIEDALAMPAPKTEEPAAP